MHTFFSCCHSFPISVVLPTNLLSEIKLFIKDVTYQEYPLGRTYINSPLCEHRNLVALMCQLWHRNESCLRLDILAGNPSPILYWNVMEHQFSILTVCCSYIDWWFCFCSKLQCHVLANPWNYNCMEGLERLRVRLRSKRSYVVQSRQKWRVYSTSEHPHWLS